MEIRTLRYLQAVAQEGNVSNAAKSLHITQPTLSRQLSALEDELGCALFTRTHKGMELNDQGVMLLRYADSILDLVDKAQDELMPKASNVAGSVHIGAGETMNMRYIAEAIELTRSRFPKVDLQIHSGATIDLMDGFARGAYDFLIECELKPRVDMNVIELPLRDRWGVVVSRDSDLAKLKKVTPEDLLDHSLIMPRQAFANGTLGKWAGDLIDRYQSTVQFNLPLNASILAREGVGALLTYEGLIETSKNSSLAFVPLYPELTSTQGIIWRKMALSKQAEAFLDALREVLAKSDISPA